MSFADDLENLESAEEFLDYFGLEYDAGIVQVNRLHILQRFHDYLTKGPSKNNLYSSIAVNFSPMRLIGKSCTTYFLTGTKGKEALPEDDEARREVYKSLLARAYQDFVESDALTEKVFKVFHMHGPQTTFVPIGDLLK